MAIGKGGSSGSQSGVQSGNTSTAGLNAGVALPIAPEGWENAWRSIMGQGGQTPGQTTAANYFTGQLGAPMGELNGVNRFLSSKMDERAAVMPHGQAITSQQLGPERARAALGSEYMGNYTNPYTNQVVGASLADLDSRFARALNQSDMNAAAALAFGGSRHAIRDRGVVEDYLRNVAATSANLRNQGFNTALNAGLTDAGNVTGVNVGNADRALNAGQINASNDLAAQQANRAFAGQEHQANINSIYQDRSMDMAGAGQIANNIGLRSNIQMNNANSLAGIGGNQFAQGIQALLAGQPLFGSSNLGFNLGAADSYGQGSGNNSSKGGGVSVG